MALTHAQKTGLEAAILAYLAAEGGRFARTVAAFKEEAQVGGGGDEGNQVVSGAVLEKAWAHLHHTLKSKSKANQKAFFAAIESGDVAEVQLYACVGVDVEAFRNTCEFRYGNDDDDDEEAEEVDVSPLFWAARHDQLAIVVAEVQLYGCVGIDVKAFRNTCEFRYDNDDDDEEEAEEVYVSPLYWATQHDQLAIVKYFVASGHDKDVCDDNDDLTPLYVAARNNYIAVVQYLVEQGADKEKGNRNDATPLYIAAEKGNFRVVQYLVEQGADKDKARDNGCTPLFIAAQ